MPGLSRSKQKRQERKAEIEKSLQEVTFKSQSNDNTYAEPDSYSQKKSETKSEEKESGQISDDKIQASKGFDSKADFLSFDEIDEKKVAPKNEAFEQIQIKYDRVSYYPWVSDRTLRIKDIYAMLHSEILDYVKWIEQSPEEKSTRENLVKRIKKVVKGSYPDAVVMVFGSCATGLNLPMSDIDLLVYNP